MNNFLCNMNRVCYFLIVAVGISMFFASCNKRQKELPGVDRKKISLRVPAGKESS